jgi:hypothetical protein
MFEQLGAVSPAGVQQQIGLASKQQEQKQKVQKEQRESELLSRLSRGEELSAQEQAELSPTTQRSLIQAKKPVFETEAQKIEAKRVAEIASDITKEAEAITVENSRLDRMETLSNEGNLSTPLMVKTLDKIGLPLSVLGNPTTEEFAKLEADFVRDVSKVFPGQIRVYEIQAYMKTIPGLLNSAEGRDAIIRNRRILNDMKQIRFDALKDIIKENDGQRPPNLDLLIDERIGDQQAELANRFSKGITEDIEDFQPKFRMVDDQGNIFEIPNHLAPQATQQGLKFQ